MEWGYHSYFLGGDFVLLIQAIDLIWNKKERGSEYARVRRQFPMAYSLEGVSFSDNVVVHRLDFFQQGKQFIDSIQKMKQSLEQQLPKMGFSYEQIQQKILYRTSYMKKYRLQCYHSITEVNLTNLAIRDSADCYEISFYYDENRSGMPVRHGHNQSYQDLQSPFYRKDCLNEIAFVLAQQQYGRILWNERRKDYDTGMWYYQFHIYNLFYFTGKVPENDIFVYHKPDFEYRQIAGLY